MGQIYEIGDKSVGLGIEVYGKLSLIEKKYHLSSSSGQYAENLYRICLELSPDVPYYIIL